MAFDPCLLPWKALNMSQKSNLRIMRGEMCFVVCCCVHSLVAFVCVCQTIEDKYTIHTHTNAENKKGLKIDEDEATRIECHMQCNVHICMHA